MNKLLRQQAIMLTAKLLDRIVELDVRLDDYYDMERNKLKRLLSKSILREQRRSKLPVF